MFLSSTKTINVFITRNPDHQVLYITKFILKLKHNIFVQNSFLNHLIDSVKQLFESFKIFKKNISVYLLTFDTKSLSIYRKLTKFVFGTDGKNPKIYHKNTWSQKQKVYEYDYTCILKYKEKQ